MIIYRSFNLSIACDNCPNDFCSCRNYEENPDYIACVDHFDLIYRNCMFDCDHNDNSCYADCNRKYDENIQNCPCKSNCPDGCPCPNYECPGTTPGVTTGVSSTTRMTTTAAEQMNSTVLVVSARGNWKPAKDLRLDLETWINFLLIHWKLCSLIQMAGKTKWLVSPMMTTVRLAQRVLLHGKTNFLFTVAIQTDGKSIKLLEQNSQESERWVLIITMELAALCETTKFSYASAPGIPSIVELHLILWNHLLIFNCQIMHIFFLVLLPRTVCVVMFLVVSNINVLAHIMAAGAYSPDNLKTELYNDETGVWTVLDDYPYSGLGSTF